MTAIRRRKKSAAKKSRKSSVKTKRGTKTTRGRSRR